MVLSTGCSGIPLKVTVDETCTVLGTEMPPELKAWFRAQYNAAGAPLPMTPPELKPWLDRQGDQEAVIDANCPDED